MIRFALIALMFCVAPASAMGPWKAAETCLDEVPCQIGARSYHISEPQGWNGTDPLPVLLHFHGWGRQGSLIVRHDRIASATTKRGVLLVAPNGLGKTWDFWNSGGRDTGFARAVLEDVNTRYPVSEGQIFVSGYSYGSLMAWRFVCEDGADIAALLAIAGTLSQSERCDTAPGEVRQVYGLNDQVLAYPFGVDGAPDHAVALWRDHMGCAEAQSRVSWQQRPFLTLTRTTWETCQSGRVSLDTHPGGHFIPHGWIARHLDELLGLPFSYP